MRLADFIACPTQIGKEKFIVMQFQIVIKVIGAYDNVIVQMLAVDMRGDDCFTVAEAFDKLHPDFVDLLRRNIFSGHKDWTNDRNERRPSHDRTTFVWRETIR